MLRDVAVITKLLHLCFLRVPACSGLGLDALQQHVAPEDMHFKNEAQVITVYASKTTEKKVEFLYVIISVCAYIAEDSWLERGSEFMKEMGSGVSRDYLPDKLEFRKAPPQYHHVLCMS